MSNHTVFVILIESFIAYWFLTLIWSRQQAAQAKEAEKAKYKAWDEAYSKALWSGKGPCQATAEALKTTPRARPEVVLRAWDTAYNQAIAKGIRKYTAGVKASAAAREIAHKEPPVNR